MTSQARFAELRIHTASSSCKCASLVRDSWQLDYVQMIVPQSYPDSFWNTMPSINETPYNFSCVCRPFFYGCPLQQRILSQKCPGRWWQGQRGQGCYTPIQRGFCDIRTADSPPVVSSRNQSLVPASRADAMTIFCNKNSFNKWLGTRWKSEKMEVFTLTPHDERSENGERPENKRNFPKPHVRNSLASCCYQATGETPLVLPRLQPHLLCQHRRDRRDRHATGLGTSKSMLKFIVPVSGCHDIPFGNMSHP